MVTAMVSVPGMAYIYLPDHARYPSMILVLVQHEALLPSQLIQIRFETLKALLSLLSHAHLSPIPLR